MNEFSNARYEVLAICYGTRQTSAQEVFLNYHIYGEPDRPLGMDHFFWVARNEARTVVIDTGFSPEGGAKRDRTMLRTAGEAPGHDPEVGGPTGGAYGGSPPKGRVHARSPRPVPRQSHRDQDFAGDK